MKLYDYTNIPNIYIQGDTHGQWGELFFWIKDSYKRKNESTDESTEMFDTFFGPYKEGNTNYNDSIIIILGDCGLGFEKEKYYHDIFTKCNKILAEHNTHLLMIRGNHDDPRYYQEELINYSNIKSIPDYSIIQTLKGNMLCIGGGISIDRIWRKQKEAKLNKYKSPKSKNRKQLYWENELPVINPNLIKDLKDLNTNVDIILTHAAPSCAIPFDKEGLNGWFIYDKDLAKDLTMEHQILDDIMLTFIKNDYHIKYWLFGHYHTTYNIKENNIYFHGFSDTILPININEIMEIEE